RFQRALRGQTILPQRSGGGVPRHLIERGVLRVAVALRLENVRILGRLAVKRQLLLYARQEQRLAVQRLLETAIHQSEEVPQMDGVRVAIAGAGEAYSA